LILSKQLLFHSRNKGNRTGLQVRALYGMSKLQFAKVHLGCSIPSTLLATAHLAQQVSHPWVVLLQLLSCVDAAVDVTPADTPQPPHISEYCKCHIEPPRRARMLNNSRWQMLLHKPLRTRPVEVTV
jgi:hypothetical protein